MPANESPKKGVLNFSTKLRLENSKFGKYECNLDSNGAPSLTIQLENGLSAESFIGTVITIEATQNGNPIVLMWTVSKILDQFVSDKHVITIFEDADPRYYYYPEDGTFTTEEIEEVGGNS